MTAIPRNMQPILKQKLKVNYKQLRKEKRRKCISSVWVTTCFRPSLGSDSDTSSGRTDTSATTIKISTFHCETLPMFRKPPAEKGKIQAVLLSKHCKSSEIISKFCKLSDKKKNNNTAISPTKKPTQTTSPPPTTTMSTVTRPQSRDKERLMRQKVPH